MSESKVIFLHDFLRDLSDEQYYYVLTQNIALVREHHFDVDGTFYTYRMREWQRRQGIEVAP